MWKDSNRNIVVIFQPNILRIVGFYVRHSAIEKKNSNFISLKIVEVAILSENTGHFVSCSACNNSYFLLNLE